MSYVVTTAKDTIYVNSFKIKVKFANGAKKRFPHDEIKSLYDSAKTIHYQKIEHAFVHYPEHSGTVFFAKRLTAGKVKIFHAVTSYSLSFPENSYGNRYSSYYIGIYNSKPELINNDWDLKLTKDVYDFLKLYLHSNDKIQKKLDNLFFSKEEDEEIENKIVSLVNEYNTWAESTK